LGVCDPVLAAQNVTEWRSLPVLGSDDALHSYSSEDVRLVIGIGHLPGQVLRRTMFENLCARGYRCATLIHPAAVLGEGVILGDGTQVMAGAVIQADTVIGPNCIVNTRASVDHDCWLDAHVHIAPGAILCGGVQIGEGTFVGSGATIIQGVSVGEMAVIGAGAVLVRDLESGRTSLGSSMRNMQKPE
jgi:UDP-perosamine 4-acetyltransferase